MLSHSTRIFLAATVGPLFQPHPSGHGALLILRLFVIVVIGGMNLLYWLFMRNGKADYFESLGKTDLINNLGEPEDEYAPIVERPRHCDCGFDLSANPQKWRQNSGEFPSRCPECGREVRPQEYDLSVPPVVGEQTIDEQG